MCDSGTNETIVTAYEVRRPGYGNTSCTYGFWKDIEAEFDGAEEGEVINIRIVRMTKHKLDNLPDFEGW